MKCYFAEVRDINDPTQSGRCKVRIYGQEDNEQEVKDDQLPWAVSLMPSTSASTNRMGAIPTGMVQGSRVLVMFLDEEEQYPIILGSFHRSLEPKHSQNESDSNKDDKNSAGEDGIDIPRAGRTKGDRKAQTKNPNNKITTNIRKSTRTPQVD